MGKSDLRIRAYYADAIQSFKAGVEETAEKIEKMAKRKAPIRGQSKSTRIFKGGASANTYRSSIIARRNFKKLAKHEAMAGEFEHRGSYFAYQPPAIWPNELTARGRAELRAGIRDLQAGRESSVIEVPITTAAHLRQAMRSVTIEQATTIGLRGGRVQTKTKKKSFKIGRASGFGHTYMLQIGGRLKRDIERRLPTVQGNEIVSGVDSGAPYSVHVEFGTTSHGKAQPFLRPALKAHRRALKQDLKAAYGDR